MVESIEPDEEGNRDYLTVIEDEVKSDAKEDSEVYKLDESEKVEYSSDNIDQINRLYVGAYTVKKDFEKVIEYSRKLQASENTYSVYLGKYTVYRTLRQNMKK